MVSGDAKTRSRRVWAPLLVLLMAAVVIFSHVDDLSMWDDEMFSMHHASGPFELIFRDPELMWPPGYYLLLHPWMKIAGWHDLSVHTLGALLGMLSAAVYFQVGRRLHSTWTGWLAALLVGTSNYTLYFFLEARGYSLVILLGGLAVWMHLRWLARPTWRRAVPYVLALIGLWYVQYAGLLITAILGGHVLLAAPRRLPRWLAGLAAVVLAYLPMWSQFFRAMQVRGAAGGDLPSYFLHGPEEVVRAYSASHDWALGLILALAGGGLVLLLRRRRTQVAAVLWLAGWGIGVPIFAYLTRHNLALHTARYLMWTAPGLLLLVGLGLSRLPRWWRWGAVALVIVLALLPWNPFAFRPAYSDSPPVRDLLRWLGPRFLPGDALVVDPGCVCGDSLTWWYYENLYLPGGRPLARATDPAAVDGTVWLLSRQGNQDPALRAAAQAGRFQTEFWGPWYFIVEHWEAPPLTPGYLLGDIVRYQGSVIVPRGPYRPGDAIQVESWWAVDEPLDRDYSLSLQLVDSLGQMIVQNDSGPLGPFTPDQTAFWEPGHPYRDDRTVVVPWGTPAGYYQLRLAVYYWEDGQRLPPEQGAPQEEDSLLLATVQVVSWAVP